MKTKRGLFTNGHTLSGKMNTFWFVLGLLAVLFMGLPYLLLGQDAIVVYHDQLDGEVIAYLLQAKHLFQGDVLPEFLNGASKTALIPPAPAFVLLFLGGNAYAALVCMQLLGSVCGYVGMYLLIKEVIAGAKLSLSEKSLPACFVAVATGVLYAYLPFLPVYGLSQYGLPLLLWCLLQVKKGRFLKVAYVYAAVYALCSSLVLVGFGVLGAMALWLIVMWVSAFIRKKKEHQEKEAKSQRFFGENIRLWSIWLVMLLIYMIENIPLLQQTFGLGQAGGEVSHKAEYVLAASDFWSSFWQGITQGGQHSGDYHYLFLVAAFIIVVMCIMLKKSGKMLRIMGTIFAWNVFFALVAALWDSAFGILIRSRLSALGAFQMNRLLWMAPCLWYLLFACSMALAVVLWQDNKGKWKLTGGVACVVMAAALCITTGKVLVESNLKPNIQKLRNSEYRAFSFGDYYAVGVMEQVRDYIQSTTGQAQEDYRVVSLGIDPAAALYHGFYCLDGYSNNYSLDYKHTFRKIIEPELSKSEYLRNNFDTWGNRCYLFSAECPGYFTIEKNGFFFQNYSLDTDSLKKLGGKYVLSAAYIQNADEAGLRLVREEPFETEESYYRVFLYEVK